MTGLVCSLQCPVSFAQESSLSSISANKEPFTNKGPYELSFADFDWRLNDARPVFNGTTAHGERLPTKKAIDLFVNRVGQEPNDFASRAILGELYLRQAIEDDYLPAYKLAMDALGDSLKIKSDYKPAIQGMARTMMAQHQLQQVVNQHPSPPSLTLVGDLYFFQGETDKAREFWDHAELDQSSLILFVSRLHTTVRLSL